MADELFDLDLQEIGVFGTPWHGKVQGGALTLPNASQMAYQQPSAKATRLDSHDSVCQYFDAAQAGTCHLVAAPGLPAVSRTSEEQAADADAGQQWLTKATLTGGRLQLYGHNLSGWIYIDSVGDRWLVTCPSFWPYPTLPANAKTTALNASVRLTRFGVVPIGGVVPEPEYYDYPVSLASGWLSSASPAEYVRMTIDAITKSGNKCAVGLHSGANEVEGYIQLSLSGLGAAATVGLTVLRTYAQCAAATNNKTMDAGEGFFTGSAEWSFSRLHALWYDDQDDVVEVRVNGTGQYSWDEVVNAGVGSYSYSGAASISLNVGGLDVDSVELAASVNDAFSAGLSTGESVWSIGSQSFPSSWSNSPGRVDAEVDSHIMSGSPSATWSPLSVIFPSAVYTGANGGGGRCAVYAICHSRHCVGLWTSVTMLDNFLNVTSVVAKGRVVATPSGVRGSEVALGVLPSSQRRRDWALNQGAVGWTNNDCYGAWDPLTGDVSLWQSSPICFV
jgi:hypothetical protein